MCNHQSECRQWLWKLLDLQRAQFRQLCCRAIHRECSRSKQRSTCDTWPQHQLNTTHWRRRLSLCWTTTRCPRHTGLKQCSTHCYWWFLCYISSSLSDVRVRCGINYETLFFVVFRPIINTNIGLYHSYNYITSQLVRVWTLWSFAITAIVFVITSL